MGRPGPITRECLLSAVRSVEKRNLARRASLTSGISTIDYKKHGESGAFTLWYYNCEIANK